MSFELNAGCELPKSTEDQTKYADINVTYNGTSTTAEVISVKVDENGGQTVHVNVKNVDRTALPSVTEFVFGEYGISTFRNLYTTYTETTVDEVTTDTADTSWYNTTDDEFVIATSADIYGLAKIVNGTATDITADTFANKTIYVVSDIEVNKDLSITITESTTVATNGTATVTGNDFGWTPIGKTTAFAGTFEGNMHTISGIYANASEVGLGLFAATVKGSTIQNLKLKNSYFYNSYESTETNGTGSIVGQCAGNLVNIYSNAYVRGYNYSGGIIGEILTSSDYLLTIKQCWYDGNVKAGAYRHGGIVGRIAGGKIVMEDCLNTGNIYCSSKTFKGGLCGSVQHDTDYTIDLTMRNSLNCGLIKDYVSNTNASKVRAGRIVGAIDGASTTVVIGNVYATEECYLGTEPTSGCGYKTTKPSCEMSVTIVTEIDLQTWGFDTSIWGLADDGTPMLNMTPVATK